VWLFKGILFLVLLFLLVSFFVTNSDQEVDVKIFGREFDDVSLYWVISLSFLLGFVLCFFLAAWRELRLHGRIRRLKHQLAEREHEIVQLRALPLQDLPIEGEPEAEDRE
jgi:uncharacterized integral membrane protein